MINGEVVIIIAFIKTLPKIIALRGHAYRS